MIVKAKQLERNAPPEVVELVKRGDMTISGAHDVLAHATPSERAELEEAVKPIPEDVPLEQKKQVAVERQKRVHQVKVNSQARRRSRRSSMRSKGRP